ncbi:M15 family metallopeptidase [Paracoccus seriniphilus]|uniref:D-alanyl-D-alanine carboxypeptidase n=1 Tax=Paracoccus seriniphilus TaxID=184748 RepID=A0A239Q2U3_9RHOB|nr:M15 family metallopeptidase [Paracoccus seriniphilus]WCR16116.1 M15 family metallopeptidase [Paracoccus seriniphilus]SNT76267.1 D-alanyl-D-alanine carboxypeptidase [Paracoccus seriniphilus]
MFRGSAAVLAVAVLAFGLLGSSAGAQQCPARDFLSEPMPADFSAPDRRAAILQAYPDLMPGEGPGSLIGPDGSLFTISGPTDRAARARLEAPTMGDQFIPVYPLSRDLDSRTKPFFDPGRVRDGAFFAMLYGNDRAQVEAALETVVFGNARFHVTTRHGVACQLRSAFASLEPQKTALAPFFETVGGGYAWRPISGTNRLSPHSWGIAIDINASLGGYWRWTGASEGAVGDYDNRVPWSLVEAMERSGFIWGGKWHHFDGMHFEFRPELILYGRMAQGDR